MNDETASFWVVARVVESPVIVPGQAPNVSLKLDVIKVSADETPEYLAIAAGMFPFLNLRPATTHEIAFYYEQHPDQTESVVPAIFSREKE